MVKVMAPCPADTVVDPACGTNRAMQDTQSIR
jgi:hypothetical protein